MILYALDGVGPELPEDGDVWVAPVKQDLKAIGVEVNELEDLTGSGEVEDRGLGGGGGGECEQDSDDGIPRTHVGEFSMYDRSRHASVRRGSRAGDYRPDLSPGLFEGGGGRLAEAACAREGSRVGWQWASISYRM